MSHKENHDNPHTHGTCVLIILGELFAVNNHLVPYAVGNQIFGEGSDFFDGEGAYKFCGCYATVGAVVQIVCSWFHFRIKNVVFG